MKYLFSQDKNTFGFSEEKRRIFMAVEKFPGDSVDPNEKWRGHDVIDLKEGAKEELMGTINDKLAGQVTADLSDFWDAKHRSLKAASSLYLREGKEGELIKGVIRKGDVLHNFSVKDVKLSKWNAKGEKGNDDIARLWVKASFQRSEEGESEEHWLSLGRFKYEKNKEGGGGKIILDEGDMNSNFTRQNLILEHKEKPNLILNTSCENTQAETKEIPLEDMPEHPLVGEDLDKDNSTARAFEVHESGESGPKVTYLDLHALVKKETDESAMVIQGLTDETIMEPETLYSDAQELLQLRFKTQEERDGDNTYLIVRDLEDVDTGNIDGITSLRNYAEAIGITFDANKKPEKPTPKVKSELAKRLWAYEYSKATNANEHGGANGGDAYMNNVMRIAMFYLLHKDITPNNPTAEKTTMIQGFDIMLLNALGTTVVAGSPHKWDIVAKGKKDNVTIPLLRKLTEEERRAYFIRELGVEDNDIEKIEKLETEERGHYGYRVILINNCNPEPVNQIENLQKKVEKIEIDGYILSVDEQFVIVKKKGEKEEFTRFSIDPSKNVKTQIQSVIVAKELIVDNGL